MRICVIGNSHVACLKSAWSTLETECDEHTLKFFAGPKSTLAELSLDEKSGRLVSTSTALTASLRMTSGGEAEIDVDHYDLFLLVGLLFWWPSIPRQVSRAVQVALAQDVFAKTLSANIAALLRRCTQAPILVTAVPRPVKHEAPRELSATLPLATVAEIFSEAHVSTRWRFFAQPSTTLGASGYTLDHLSKDAPRLAHTPMSVGQVFDDKNSGHMNTEFGRLFLTGLFESLRAAREDMPRQN
jgi:hypothetical protein